MKTVGRRNFKTGEMAEGIRAGSRQWLGRAITLVESTLEEDRRQASQLMDLLMPDTGRSVRIGITGVPGVGKSTFIEALGTHLTAAGHKIAVLSIDPTSGRSKGSILGDKTRMPTLSADPNAFIRPSPSGLSLGGVAHSTREAVHFCEASGFAYVLVETVGVGQSETLVKEMVDFFLLLMLPGSGDELQGIKRGIMEMADGIFINKADGNEHKAQLAQKDFLNALHLFPPHPGGWVVPVRVGSSITHAGIDTIWEDVLHYTEKTQENGWFSKARGVQKMQWLDQLLKYRLSEYYLSTPSVQEMMKKVREDILHRNISVTHAVDSIMTVVLRAE